jgi:hypothetical protein
MGPSRSCGFIPLRSSIKPTITVLFQPSKLLPKNLAALAGKKKVLMLLSFKLVTEF